MITISHPYGKTKFKEVIIVKRERYKLIDAFPNHSGIEGHKHAKQLATYNRSIGYKAIVIAKTNASAVYVRKKRRKNK